MHLRWLIITWIASSSVVLAAAQSTARVSVDSSGAQANDASGTNAPSISADGRYVAFESGATDLVPGDTNGWTDIFVHDRLTGVTVRVSVDSAGVQGNSLSFAPAISPDGRHVGFVSYATNLVPGDTNDIEDVFVHDLVTGVTTRVNVDSSGAQTSGGLHLGPDSSPSMSYDGRWVAFASYDDDLVAGDTNFQMDTFVHDLVTGITTRVSVSSNGMQGNGDSGLGGTPSISSDGRYVAFASTSSNLVPVDSNNGVWDVFVHDRVTGTTMLVSLDSAGIQGNSSSYLPSISADGRAVAFMSLATNLVVGDTNFLEDVFVRDLTSGLTRRASFDSAGLQANAASSFPSLSADGRFVTFSSNATNLVPGDSNGVLDVFVHDMLTGATERASVSTLGMEADQTSGYRGSAISGDGRLVAFGSYARTLVPSDNNAVSDEFVRDRGTFSAFVPFCFGDGTGGACPCGNVGALGHGCENSVAIGGALLSASGVASLSADAVQLASSNELSSALSIVLQGTSAIAPINFGDGLRCAGGTLTRLYAKHAAGGGITAPQAGDASISARSSTLGDPISVGATRAYHVYYRDPNLGFCAGGFNATNAVAIAWGS